jgi:hypothetical protein
MWISTADVLAALGPVADPLDPFLETATAAADAFAQRRRASAGYIDDPDVSPGPDVTTGTTLYAVALFRERGAVDSFASFDAFQTGVIPSGSMGQVLRLLGVGRPAVDRPYTDAELQASRTRYRLGVRDV